MKYFDKHGHEIKAGNLVSIAGYQPELVYETDTQQGEIGFGVNASNEDYLKSHPNAVKQYYSLSNFEQEDIEIVAV